MKQKRLTVCLLLLAAFVFTAGFVAKKITPITTRISFVDSGSFKPNSAGGWTIYSYYLKKDAHDKVGLELILKHNNNINWSKEQWIGTINGLGYLPKTERSFTYNLLPNSSWSIRIGSDGKCFLNILKGSPPQADPVIIPIKVKY